MNEILTCEEYVLNELRIAKEELSLVKKEIEELKFEKETLLNQLKEKNKLVDYVMAQSNLREFTNGKHYFYSRIEFDYNSEDFNLIKPFIENKEEFKVLIKDNEEYLKEIGEDEVK